MPRKVKKKHDFVIGLFSQVDAYLSEDTPDPKQLPTSLVNFCVVAEKVLKMHLYKKNKTLPYDVSKLKDANLLVAVATGKESNDVGTIQYEEVIQRFGAIYKRTFTEEEFEILKDLYKLRNCFMHTHKADDEIDFDSEDIIKKMGTLWPTISKLAIKVLDKAKIKSSRPKKTYSEEELRAVLVEEVRKKINQPIKNGPVTYSDLVNQSTIAATGPSCPRCGSEKFGRKTEPSSPLSPWDNGTVVWTDAARDAFVSIRQLAPDIYKCKKCNLELTEKEYELYKSDIMENGTFTG